MKKEVLERLSALIIGAFALVAALAWNDYIRSLFQEGGALEFLRTGGPLIYALFVTFLAVFVTIWISKLTEKAKETQDKEIMTKIAKKITKKEINKATKKNP